MAPESIDTLATLLECGLGLMAQLGGSPAGGNGAPSVGLSQYMGLIAPVAILLMAFQKKGPAWHFLKAGATSPETARRPRSVEVDNTDLLSGPVRRGVLVATGDGRFFVNEQAYHRWRRAFLSLASALTLALMAAVFWLFVL